MRTLLAGAALLLAACASTQSPDGAMPPPPAAQQQQTAASDQRLDELQTTLTELLERIDVLNQRIARMEEERVVRGSAAPPPPPESVPEARTTPAPAPAQAQAQPQAALVGAKLADDYRRAIMLFGRGSYAEARKAFQAVYDSDQTGDLADNALFWIGETYFAARDYNNAMRFYARVTTDYADQNKAPDALYKTALAQEKTGDLALARKTLQQVIERYPYSTFATSSKQELQRIRY